MQFEDVDLKRTHTPCDIRYCLYSLTINSLISTPSKSEILSKLLRSG